MARVPRLLLARGYVILDMSVEAAARVSIHMVKTTRVGNRFAGSHYVPHCMFLPEAPALMEAEGYILLEASPQPNGELRLVVAKAGANSFAPSALGVPSNSFAPSVLGVPSDDQQRLPIPGTTAMRIPQTLIAERL
jgi:hypothetical protein